MAVLKVSWSSLIGIGIGTGTGRGIKIGRGRRRVGGGRRGRERAGGAGRAGGAWLGVAVGLTVLSLLCLLGSRDCLRHLIRRGVRGETKLTIAWPGLTHLCLSLLDILRMWSGFTLSLREDARSDILLAESCEERLTWVSVSCDWSGC